MRNHGLLTVGRDIGEAFTFMRRLIYACELHERVMATGAEISEISQDVKDFTRTQHEKRRANQPYGGPEWRMTRRLAESLYPDHGT
jgi:ribulose-5-phosphate 4-epimerase/fuculose-1-phosphate aldolase